MYICARGLATWSWWCELLSHNPSLPPTAFAAAHNPTLSLTQLDSLKALGHFPSMISLSSLAKPSGALASSPHESSISPARLSVPIFNFGRAESLDPYLLI